MKLPDFLTETQLTKADAVRLQPHMSNWLTAHAHIRTLDANASALRELEKMLVYELTLTRRLHILHRLRSRYNNLRIKHEDKQLFAITGGK